MDLSVLIEKLRHELPPVFIRREVPKLLGGLLAVGTLANLDSLGQGPPRIRSKRHVAYERDSFLAWLGVWLGLPACPSLPSEHSDNKSA